MWIKWHLPVITKWNLYVIKTPLSYFLFLQNVWTNSLCKLFPACLFSASFRFLGHSSKRNNDTHNEIKDIREGRWCFLSLKLVLTILCFSYIVIASLSGGKYLIRFTSYLYIIMIHVKGQWILWKRRIYVAMLFIIIYNLCRQQYWVCLHHLWRHWRK